MGLLSKLFTSEATLVKRKTGKLKLSRCHQLGPGRRLPNKNANSKHSCVLETSVRLFTLVTAPTPLQGRKEYFLPITLGGSRYTAHAGSRGRWGLLLWADRGAPAGVWRLLPDAAETGRSPGPAVILFQRIAVCQRFLDKCIGEHKAEFLAKLLSLSG